MVIKDLFYMAFPLLFLIDISVRIIIYFLDKRIKRANETVLAEMKKSITIFSAIQGFIISKLKEDNEEG